MVPINNSLAHLSVGLRSGVPLISNMEIPTAISMEELTKLKDGAIEEPEAPKKQPKDYTPEEIWDLAIAYQDAMLEEFNHPLAHKVLALACLKRLGLWHQDMAEKLFSKKEDSGLGWGRDAGVLMAAHSLLTQVSLGELDAFTPDGQAE